MIALTTHYTKSYESLAAITVPILQRYADKHGYHLNINKLDDEDNVHFVRIKDAIKLLDEGFDLVFAIENDILIMDMNYLIEDFIDDEHDFFICLDRNNVNAGTFIVKATERGKDLLKFIVSQQGLFETEQNVLENYTDERIKYLPHPSINSIPYELYKPSYGKIGYLEGEQVFKPTHEQGCYETGDFLLHLPGTTLNRRIEIFKDYLKDIVYE